MDHADRAAQADGARVVPWPAVALFVGTAVALAWLVALPLWLGDGLASPLVGALLPVMMFAPGIATLVVCLIARVPGRGRRMRFLGMWPLRPAGRTIGFLVAAVVVPPLIVALTVSLSGALGLVRLDLVGFSGFAGALEQAGVDLSVVPIQAVVVGQLIALPLGALINAIPAFGEEIGWRGWLLSALRPLGVWPSLLVTGAVWGLWHAPIILLGYNFGRGDVIGVLLMVAGCMAWGVLLGWSRLRTGSVWPAVVAHGALNAAAGLLALLVAVGERPDPALVGPLGAVSWLVLAVLVGVLALTGQFRRDVLEPPREARGVTG
ncbi:CPBP family intramembrane metalloprotease [Microbacterium paludicola]|uniref:CPBP family intramembrane metalloprotease n=1 Tax=Microbacterium paludicola TaxID=300019 RepID=A0A4Y9FZD6_9MICO|nr:CPBP family intramembrane glutamic endopeptidase [Microbacterium paludicola]MBF0815783.1 CPBP family intramembrane metalloprotease [Microbacterium paludicola]TFU33613.1 CPBP family intramembrane metalloprotease [Microbacterium paludicola]